MKTILLAFDSFKGSLSSREVAEAFAEGVRQVMPDCEIRQVCIADGGEGTAEALMQMPGGKWVERMVSDPLGRTVCARYGVTNEGETAVIEMAAASGLPLLKEEERDPWRTTTYGTGELMADALRRGCRKLLVGIGGSATNDGGMGALIALGFRFLDKERRALDGCGASLEKVVSINDSAALPELKGSEITVACDVDNPFCGRNGAAYVFAPQKGADAETVERLDKGLEHFAKVVEQYNHVNIKTMPGAGAAGGLGGGLVALLGAKLCKGIDAVLDTVHFDKLLKGCDLVVTGEGRIDRQTVMGKAPSGVLRRATEKGIPVIAIGGGVEPCKELDESGFSAIHSINTEGLPLSIAMQPEVTRENLRRMAEKLFGFHYAIQVSR